MPPRPPLQKLGITYRRVPVLAIGADVYFDTSLAVIALEAKYPDVDLKGRSWGVQTASGLFWSDRALFAIAGGLMSWNNMPQEFIKDREQYKGQPIDPKLIELGRPKLLSALRQHLASLECLASRMANMLITGPVDST